MSVRIAATGVARFGKRAEGLVELLAEAGRAALDGTDGSPAPEALVVGTMSAGTLAGQESLGPKLANALGAVGIPCFRVEAASATGAAAFHAAADLVHGGAFQRVLVVAGEKMTATPVPLTTLALSRSLSDHEVAHGATMPGMAALVTQLYLRRHEGRPEDLSEVSVRNRACAAHNVRAQLQKAVTREEVQSSRVIADPLRLLHVAPISDGAAAAVLERGSQGVVVRGLGQGTDLIEVFSRNDPTSFRATRLAAQRAYDQAGIGRKEVQVAEVHDAFAPFQLIDLEDLGFCGPGEGARWTREGRGDPSGVLPINPSGGLLGRGHPIGASGLVQIVEIDRQLRREAGPMQAGAPRVGLAQSVGGLGSQNVVTILGREGA